MSGRPVHGCPIASRQHAWIHGVPSSTCPCIGISFITAVEGHYPRQMHLNRGTVRAWRRRWSALTSQLEQLAAEGVSDKGLTTVIEEVLTDILRPGAPAT